MAVPNVQLDALRRCGQPSISAEGGARGPLGTGFAAVSTRAMREVTLRLGNFDAPCLFDAASDHPTIRGRCSALPSLQVQTAGPSLTSSGANSATSRVALVFISFCERCVTSIP